MRPHIVKLLPLHTDIANGYECSRIGVGEGIRGNVPPAWKLSGQIWNISGQIWKYSGKLENEDLFY